MRNESILLFRIFSNMNNKNLFTNNVEKVKKFKRFNVSYLGKTTL